MRPRLTGNVGARVKKPAILLVDDDLLLLALTAEILTDLGYQVTTAQNGSQALAVLQSGHPVDMLVTDVQMPDLHGFELARRAKQIRPVVAVLYCTGRTDLIVEEMGPALGPVITKPVVA